MNIRSLLQLSALALLVYHPVQGFSTPPFFASSVWRGSLSLLAEGNESQQDLRKEADALLSKARQLRLEIGDLKDECNDLSNRSSTTTDATPRSEVSSPWRVDSNEQEEGIGYRLYVDIGREEGTWMDRRWGSSGRRIPFTVDVKFLQKVATVTEVSKMVKDNFGGKSSQPCKIATAEAARLRGGFEKMKCNGGCYRIDSSDGRQYTIRFYLEVDGTKPDQGFGYVES